MFYNLFHRLKNLFTRARLLERQKRTAFHFKEPPNCEYFPFRLCLQNNVPILASFINKSFSILLLLFPEKQAPKKKMQSLKSWVHSSLLTLISISLTVPTNTSPSSAVIVVVFCFFVFFLRSLRQILKTATESNRVDGQ